MMKDLQPDAGLVHGASLDLKMLDDEGTFEGYASLFGIEDLARDVVLPGAFAASLARRGTAGIRLLFQHDPSEPIGVWLDIAEDERGLFVRGRLMPEIARAREVLALVRAGAVDGLSIGFRIVRGLRDRTTGLRRLEEIDLWEISVVTFPMQPAARISDVKAGVARGVLTTQRQLERWLTRDAGLSRSDARTLLGSGFRSLAATREARGRPRADRRLVEVIGEARVLLETTAKEWNR